MAGILTPQFIRFILAGGIAAGANLGSRFVFNQWMSYEVAIVLAYLVGMFVAFLLMRGHVFNAHGQSLGLQILKFAGINLFAVVQTLIISVVLARWVLPTLAVQNHVEAIAHLVGVLVPVISSYFGHKFITFR